jgi:hypothetical protein
MSMLIVHQLHEARDRVLLLIDKLCSDRWISVAAADVGLRPCRRTKVDVFTIS